VKKLDKELNLSKNLDQIEKDIKDYKENGA